MTVTAEAPLLKTESGELSHNVTTDRIDNLPLLPTGASAGNSGIRNPYAVVALMPGSYYIGTGAALQPARRFASVALPTNTGSPSWWKARMQPIPSVKAWCSKTNPGPIQSRSGPFKPATTPRSSASGRRRHHERNHEVQDLTCTTEAGMSTW